MTDPLTGIHEPTGKIEKYLTGVLEERFWSRIKYSNSCWGWTGSVNKAGYGCLIIKKPRTRKTILMLAHRISWFLHHHYDPKEMCVLHHCDNPPCVNPEHLFLGTQLDNIKDMVKKCREAHGENCSQAKLTNEDVFAIRDKYSKGNITQHELGETYGVHRVHVGRIVNQKIWKHI